MKTLLGTNLAGDQPHKRPLLANCSKTEPSLHFQSRSLRFGAKYVFMSGFSSFWRLFCNQLFLTEKELLREVQTKLHLLYFTNNPNAKRLHFMYWKCSKADIVIQACGNHFPFSISIVIDETSWTLLLPQTYPHIKKWPDENFHFHAMALNGFQGAISFCGKLSPIFDSKLWLTKDKSWARV